MSSICDHLTFNNFISSDKNKLYLSGLETCLSIHSKKVAISKLDCILKFAGSNIKPRFFSPIDGMEITPDNFPSFLELWKTRTASQIYTTTDHLFIYVEIGNVGFLYVSLDNSVRANMSGSPLKLRIPALCEVITTCIKNINKQNIVVFFSEACRPSFDGGMNNKTNVVLWEDLKTIIQTNCGLLHIGECSNNNDGSGMSFGISAFCMGNSEYIDDVILERILTDTLGCGAVGIKLPTGEIGWGVQLPLDFKGIGKENRGAKGLEGLVEIMNKHSGSVCGIGDFNMLPGQITQSIASVIPENMELTTAPFATFFGAWFDTFEPKEGMFHEL